jgi:hypothetical protein
MDSPPEAQFKELHDRIREMWDKMNIIVQGHMENSFRIEALERHASATDAMTETLREVAARIEVAGQRLTDIHERQNRLDIRTENIAHDSHTVAELERAVKGDGGLQAQVGLLKEEQAKRQGIVLAVSTAGGFLGGCVAIAGVAWTWVNGLWHWK